MLTAVILAAGESSRMGSPKALVPFHGRTFLEHLMSVAQQSGGGGMHGKAPEPRIGDIRVVLGAHADEIKSGLRLNPGVVALNPDWQHGQLSSIQAAIHSLKGSSDGIVLFLVDHPLVSAALVEKLVGEFYRSGKPIVVPTFRGKRGHPVIFAKRLFRELLDAPAEQGARAVVWAHSAEVLEVPTDEEGVLLNLNDPETLRRVLG